ncbi:MAG: hypothetical protein QXN19_00740 [Sulfolobales archaeon]
MSHTLRSGQAEVIGGLIVASVLLIVIVPLTLNIISSTTTIGTRSFVLRSQFEVERWSEKLTLSKDMTKLENSGPVKVTIVRIWRNVNGTSVPIDVQPIEIPSGEYIPITQLASTPKELEAIVTARGRVFKISELIPPTPPTGAPLGLSGNEISGGSTLFDLNISVMRCIISGKECNRPLPAIYYNNSWWAYVNGSWRPIDVKSDKTYSDLDGNNASELVVIHLDNNNNYRVLSDDNYQYAIRISNYVNIASDTKLIAVYMKALFESDKDASVVVGINVSLAHSRNLSIMVSSYAVLSSAKITRGDINLMIYEGYVLFPVKQFNYFDTLLSNNPGLYDLIIEINVIAQEGARNVYSSIEYIAVSTA